MTSKPMHNIEPVVDASASIEDPEHLRYLAATNGRCLDGDVLEHQRIQ